MLCIHKLAGDPFTPEADNYPRAQFRTQDGNAVNLFTLKSQMTVGFKVSVKGVKVTGEREWVGTLV